MKVKMNGALLLSAGIFAAAGATQGETLSKGGGDKRIVLTREQAQANDAVSFGVGGLSADAALTRAKVADGMGDVIASLRTQFAGRLAGVYMIDEPTLILRVRLKGQGGVPAQRRGVAGLSIPVVFEPGAKATISELVHSMDKHGAWVRSSVTGLQGWGTDERTGEIVLKVFAPSQRMAISKQRDTISQVLGHPVRVDYLDSPEVSADVRGGAKIYNPSNSGDYCTSGFVVKNASDTTAVSTAAHCSNTLTYLNPSGSTIPLNSPGATETLDSDQDVQLHTSSYVERAEFYADSATTARVLTGRRLRTSTASGDQVCHRGAATGYSCGIVDTTNYQPAYAGACGAMTCTATYVFVRGTADTACYPGDSGGPVFASQTAFGLLKSSTKTGKAKGDCGGFSYMSTDYLNAGWSLLYGP